MKLIHLLNVIFIVIFIGSTRPHNFVQSTSYEDCTRPFPCGNINLTYPFLDEQNNRPAYCGFPGFEVDCNTDAEISVTTTVSEKFRIRQIDRATETVSVARVDAWQGYCQAQLSNTTLNFTLYKYSSTVVNITLLYDCSPNFPVPLGPNNQLSCSDPRSYFFVPGPGSDSVAQYCANTVRVPVYRTLAEGITNASALQTAFQNGSFGLVWNADNDLCEVCRNSGGECGYNATRNRFACHCPDDQPHDYSCHDGKSSKKTGVIIGLATGGVGLIAAVLACSFVIVRRRRRSLSQPPRKVVVASDPSAGNPTSNDVRSSEDYTTTTSTSPSTTYVSHSTSYPSSKSDFENSASYFGIKVFPYTELEQATENFHESRQLGDGGFGVVYYGKLNDGRLVAVKRLYENSLRHMGQFMNEIRILAHLRHKNLVALYGCTSRKSRELLLVYEYIPNGTVADHLHGKFSESSVLPWSTRLKIAVETAEALTFLHQKEVVHRDVKTTNILLDNNFQVKVADFGLSRLFPTDVTHVSTAPQGTPGYVDPEYYQCYQLTEKSDVYSFGVVLAELISSKLAVDVSRHRHDINLANMTVDRIQNHAVNDLIDPKLLENDFRAEKMAKLVAELAFRCLQQEKDSRPSMKEVLESLIGIQNEMANKQAQVVVDIHEGDDIGLLKDAPPPFSPENEFIEKRIR